MDAGEEAKANITITLRTTPAMIVPLIESSGLFIFRYPFI
jgi:hypothetical protein